ncbi:UNVERIFIED_ORG: hypothetical protein B2H93_16700 [Clostridium botulinum]
MDTTSITQFFTPDNVNMFKDLVMSAGIVMLVAQGTKDIIDSIFMNTKLEGKISTSYYVMGLSFIQAIFFMFIFNNYEVNATNIYLTVINSFLLYFGCTKSFDFVFKKISFGNDNIDNK